VGACSPKALWWWAHLTPKLSKKDKITPKKWTKLGRLDVLGLRKDYFDLKMGSISSFTTYRHATGFEFEKESISLLGIMDQRRSGWCIPLTECLPSPKNNVLSLVQQGRGQFMK